MVRLDARSQRINSALATADCFRNINGVSMKLMNFRCLSLLAGRRSGRREPYRGSEGPGSQGNWYIGGYGTNPGG